MALVACPECQRQISTAAEACPHCGFPMREALAQETNEPTSEPAVQAGPRCYACSLGATTRCQRCGLLSCAEHVRSIYVQHGQGGAYELRCGACYEKAEAWKLFGMIWFLVVLVVGGIIALVVLSKMGKP